jgi:hypothetical protein
MQITLTRSVLAIGILALLSAISLEAQQGGTITGTVTDQVGKALPNAEVEVRISSKSMSSPRTRWKVIRWPASLTPAG